MVIKKKPNKKKMSSEFISLITSIVFAGAIFYLVQRLRHAEKRLEQVGRLSIQTLTIDDVNTICQRKIKQYEANTQEKENRQNWAVENEAVDTKQSDAPHGRIEVDDDDDDFPFENDE